MPTAQNRKLAAILFADIVGYTALMQKDEQSASNLLRHFQQQLEEKVKNFNGRIVNFYGDGALCTFQIPIDAVRCAMTLQTTFNTTPKTPVRIGIHSGTITLEGDKIFGDSVNITSRIESMGIAGGILFSKKVRDEVKNNPDLAMTSLGSFEFKNVEEPMEVFALANEGFVIPKPHELGGKVKTTVNQKKAIPFLNALKFILPVFVIGAGLLWYLTTKQKESTSQLLPKEILEERVAIGIFNNHTGEEQLDALGFLASEWLTSSLREIKIKTVSPEMVRKYNEYIGILPNNPEKKASFAEITGAQYVVSGSYFLNNDSIRLITRLLSTNSGDEIQTFPEVVLPKEQKEEIVETLRQRLLGFWSVRASKDLPNLKPPTYEAYQTYLTCRPGEIHCYLKVLEQDSTFLLAQIDLMRAAVWWRNESLHKQAKNIVQKNWAQCTNFEKKYFDQARFFGEKNYKAAFDSFNELYLEFPQNIVLLHETAWWASACLNNPYLAVERYELLFNRLDLYRNQLWNNNFYHYMDALNRLGRHRQVIEIIDKVSYDYWLKNHASNTWHELFKAYLFLDKKEEALQLIEDLEAKTDLSVINEAFYYWQVQYTDAIPNPFAASFIKQLKEEKAPVSFFGGRHLITHKPKAFGHYLLKNYPQAEKRLLELREVEWISEDSIITIGIKGTNEISIEGLLGSVYARQGKKEMALAQIQLLAQMKSLLGSNNNPQTSGLIPYLQARIYTVLGDKENAIKALQKSVEEGFGFMWGTFFQDYDLMSLKGYAPFEELIAPKRFPVKD